ncbi:MAG: hypothetical protein V1676_01775 [Candidatus Diapherotrites archaeon]
MNARTVQAVGIRLDSKMLGKLETLGKEENMDRSTVARMLLDEGLKNYVKRKAAENYKAGRTTISGAAKKAGITIWEMEQYLVSNGYRSQYSTEELQEEFRLLVKQK